MIQAYCWASGLIEFGLSVPEGALGFTQGRDERKLRDLVTVRARHAYDGVTLLVPGVPEAEDGEAALAALKRFASHFAERPERKAVRS